MNVSIVVPVLNEAKRLPVLFENMELIRTSAKLNSEDIIELILVDGGSIDATGALIQQADVVLQCQPGRAQQMNLGAQHASGDLLVFLHADTLLPAQIVDDWRAMCRLGQIWGYAPVRLDHPSLSFRVIEWCMNARSRITRIATGDQVICIQRKAFDECGGFANIELMEDVEFSSRLRKRQKPMFFRCKVNCSARKWLAHGVAKTVLLMWATRAAYFFGVHPARLHRYYYGKA